MQTDALLPPADKLKELVHATLEEVKKQTDPAVSKGVNAPEVKGVDAPEVKGVGEDKGINPILQDAQKNVDNDAPVQEKMYDIDGFPGNEIEKHIYNNLEAVNAARILIEKPTLEKFPVGGRRRSTRRRHKKSSKKSRRQSKKGGKKHRKRTSKKGGKGKKRSQRKH